MTDTKLPMPDVTNPYTFAVFPFLKTTEPLNIAGLTVRSTDDTSGLEPEQAEQIREIAEMLFLQDDLRVRSGSYCKVPFIEFRLPFSRIKELGTLDELERLQALVAYCYAQPHQLFGAPFMLFENASMAIFSPGKVLIYAVRPDTSEKYHAIHVGTSNRLIPDTRGEVDGYNGLYNFQNFFSVARGSRLYPPVNQLGLNLSQNLSADLNDFFRSGRGDYGQLIDLACSELSPALERILTSIKWFNSATSYVVGEQASIVNLAVAFETLLGLSQGDELTNRLIDSVTLLLGRFSRLDVWVSQFYKARSDIVHRGSTTKLKFVASDSRKAPRGPEYHSLLSYGRQVFRLCVLALLRGARLAEEMRLEEKLVTRQERFEQICKVFNDTSIDTIEKFRQVATLLDAIERYRFVTESAFGTEKAIGSARLSAKALLSLNIDLNAPLKALLEKLVGARDDSYEMLDSIRELEQYSKTPEIRAEYDTPRAITLRLIRTAWDMSFPLYFALEEGRRRVSEGK